MHNITLYINDTCRYATKFWKADLQLNKVGIHKANVTGGKNSGSNQDSNPESLPYMPPL